MCHAPFLFIVPAQPILRPRPPHGDDYTRRFRSIASAMAPIPARSCIIDGELTACDAHGLPDFYALHFRRSDHLCVQCFDLLELNGSDTRELPFFERKSRLERLIYKTNNDRLRLSESFDDAELLLIAAERFRLEGIVSKRRIGAYRSGHACQWIKVKYPTWRERNRDRWRLFELHQLAMNLIIDLLVAELGTPVLLQFTKALAVAGAATLLVVAIVSPRARYRIVRNPIVRALLVLLGQCSPRPKCPHVPRSSPPSRH